jgi:hypothetical protein
MEMYQVREYTPTCRFLKGINPNFTCLIICFYESMIGLFSL